MSYQYRKMLKQDVPDIRSLPMYMRNEPETYILIRVDVDNDFSCVYKWAEYPWIPSTDSHTTPFPLPFESMLKSEEYDAILNVAPIYEKELT